MITKEDLQEAIAECEGQRNPTSGTCMKLAAFYTIKDKMFPEPKSDPDPVRPMIYSGSIAPVQRSEFGQAVAELDMDQLLPIMDELMSALQVLSPKLYNGVMGRISDL